MNPMFFGQNIVAGCAGPDCISTPLALWYKADSLGLSDGTQVGTWTDSSGNGRDLTHTANPGIVYHTNILNSKPGVLFDGSDANGFTITGGWNPGSNLSAFAVVKITGSSGYRSIFGSGGSGAFQWRIDDTTNKQTVNSNATTAMGTSSTGLTSGVGAVIGTTYDGSNVRFYFPANTADGAPASSTSFSHTTDVFSYSNGSEKFIGYILEVIGYSAVISSGDRAIVTSYLQSKYGL